jgi:hypothetical protein
MKLSELNARFIGAGGEGIYQADGTPAPRREGVGVVFNCPCGCESECFIPFKNPLDGGSPVYDEPHTWERTGETIEDLTLRPSIQRIGGCAWHGFITNGETKAV